MSQLLQRDPLDRPCIEEVLQHSFCARHVQEIVTVEREKSLKVNDLDAALNALDDDDTDE